GNQKSPSVQFCSCEAVSIKTPPQRNRKKTRGNWRYAFIHRGSITRNEKERFKKLQITTFPYLKTNYLTMKTTVSQGKY
ncbi:hypothetical protein, partial [Paenibacillus mesophilus]|uniref:hypothetical protein n=1 Tax=Paenibacillus mesophilus TaxID=2582849 RepID=UPI001EE4A1A0